MPAGAIEPAAPVAEGIGLPWDVPVDDAVAAIASARAHHGDTFVVDVLPHGRTLHSSERYDWIVSCA